MLNILKWIVYRDALRHGLWPDDHSLNYAAMLVADEAEELVAEAGRDTVTDAFCEELADVIIMCLSLAGRYRINIAMCVWRKIMKNRKRSWRHRDEENSHAV